MVLIASQGREFEKRNLDSRFHGNDTYPVDCLLLESLQRLERLKRLERLEHLRPEGRWKGWNDWNIWNGYSTLVVCRCVPVRPGI
jgi:hypothetical protein